MTKRKHVSAIFTFSRNVSQFLTDALAFYAAISTAPGSSYITITAATITAAQGRVTAARTAEIAVGSGTIGLAAARDLAVALVEADVRNFTSIVQTAATNALDVATATAIVTECGLTTRRVTARMKSAFEVINNATSAGVLDFIYKAAAPGVHACYETQLSTDNVNWTSLKITPESSFTYPHTMSSGTKVYFRGRVILVDKKGGAQAWLMPSSVSTLIA